MAGGWPARYLNILGDDRVRLQTSATSNALVIENNGNVGIGITNPGALLEVNGGHFLVTNGNDTQLQIGFAGDRIQRLSDGNLQFVEDDNVVMTIASPNVGIGTTSPNAKLHIIGQAKTSNPDGSYLVPVADTDLTPKKYVDDAIEGGAGKTVGYWTKTASNDIYNNNDLIVH